MSIVCIGSCGGGVWPRGEARKKVHSYGTVLSGRPLPYRDAQRSLSVQFARARPHLWPRPWPDARALALPGAPSSSRGSQARRSLIRRCRLGQGSRAPKAVRVRGRSWLGLPLPLPLPHTVYHMVRRGCAGAVLCYAVLRCAVLCYAGALRCSWRCAVLCVGGFSVAVSGDIIVHSQSVSPCDRSPARLPHLSL